MSNHAIAVRLSAREAPARPVVARALVDFGVQVRVGERAGLHGAAATPVVGGLVIGGRPQGLFGAKHRSHTTAWVVFTDVVRSTVLNQPLDVAIARMADLIDSARDLPGATDARLAALALVQQVRGRTGRQIYDAADERADDAQDAAVGAPAGAAVAVLQDLVAAYLDLRNSTPLSVTHDTERPGGHGEGTARGALLDDEPEEAPADARDQTAQALADAERGGAQLDANAARELLWKLLDWHAVIHVAITEPGPSGAYSQVPGNSAGESQPARLAATVAQHLLTVRRAYPALYVRAAPDSEAPLRAVLGTNATLLLPDGRTVLAAIRATVAGAEAVPAVGSAAGVTTRAAAPRGTAQIVLGDDDGTPIVDTLRLGNRPLGVLGEAEGAHLTAFGLIAEGLKFAVEGVALDQVGNRVDALVTAARSLATAGRVDALMQPSLGHFAAANLQATAASRALRATRTDDPAYVGRVQDLIVAYLWLRNSLPLAAVAEGGVPAGKAEGRMLGQLREAEDAYGGDGQAPDDAEVLDALWGLLDSAALNSVAGTYSYIASPGIRDRGQRHELEKRVGDIVSTHLSTARSAFPLCVGATEMDRADSIRRFLRGSLPRHNQRPTGDAAQDVALTVDTHTAASIAHYVLTGKFLKRRTVPKPVAAPGRGGRVRQPSKRAYDKMFEGEEDFDLQEREYAAEAAEIVRPAKRHKPAPR